MFDSSPDLIPEIFLSFGDPMDVFGNRVDGSGNSFDERGKSIDVKQYFSLNGMIEANEQRETIYTKKLAEKITESYQTDNIVLSSHLIAYTAFKLLESKLPDLSIYDLVNQDAEDHPFSYAEFISSLSEYLNVLKEMEREGQTKISEILHLEPDEVLKIGIQQLGVFHNKKPLVLNGNTILSEDFKVLYYYHNRLNHFDLVSRVNWNKNVEKTKQN